MRRSSPINKPLQDLNTSRPKLKATGVLLAGGKSSRMKKDKAFLELDGKPLVEGSLSVLQTVFSEVLISSNKPDLYACYTLPIIKDETPGQGPLEGLLQGLNAANNEWVFFAACDMPFLNAGVILYLSTLLLNYDAVVPRLQSGIHPLHAFYHKRCLPAIKNNLEAGRLKIIDFYPACSVRYVEEQELQAIADLNKVFSNVNTPDDWSAILKG